DGGELLDGLDPVAAVGPHRLALRARRAEPNDAIAADHVLADLRADPIDGVGDEAAVLRGVVLLGGAEQPEVALLDQVLQRHAPAAVLLRDLDDEGEARADQAIAGASITGAPRFCERTLHVGVEGRDVVEVAAVGLEAGGAHRRQAGPPFARAARGFSRPAMQRACPRLAARSGRGLSAFAGRSAGLPRQPA